MSRILIFVILCVCSIQSCVEQETISYQEQLEKDIESVNTFVSHNNPTAIKVETGFWYSIDDLRKGIYPIPFDSVTISYTAKWIKDPSMKEADLTPVGISTSTKMLLSNTIAGLQQGLVLFPDSSAGRIYIPSGLAFGANAHVDTVKTIPQVIIPPNANLLYKVKLIGVMSTRFASDTAAIGNFIRTNAIQPIPLKDVSGIRYTIDNKTQTSTEKPKSEDAILVRYSENFLTTLDTAKVITKEFAWKDQVTAWRIMLPKYLTVGSTITLYVPSGYAHGSSTISTSGATIPTNSNMIYKITLVEINPH